MKKKEQMCSAIVSVAATKNPEFIQLFIKWHDADEDLPFSSYPLNIRYTQEWLTAGNSYCCDLIIKHFKGKLYDVTLSSVEKISTLERLRLLKELKA